MNYNTVITVAYIIKHKRKPIYFAECKDINSLKKVLKKTNKKEVSSVCIHICKKIINFDEVAALVSCQTNPEKYEVLPFIMPHWTFYLFKDVVEEKINFFTVNEVDLGDAIGFNNEEWEHYNNSTKEKLSEPTNALYEPTFSRKYNDIDDFIKNATPEDIENLDELVYCILCDNSRTKIPILFNWIEKYPGEKFSGNLNCEYGSLFAKENESNFKYGTSFLKENKPKSNYITEAIIHLKVINNCVAGYEQILEDVTNMLKLQEKEIIIEVAEKGIVKNEV